MIKRAISDTIRSTTSDFPVVLLEGPRSVGKSTILNQLATERGALLLDLDDSQTLAKVKLDPSFWLSSGQPVYFDEYQKAPEILDAIKIELGKKYENGRFVLAGSNHFQSLPAKTQALTGRLARISIDPLCQAELNGTDANQLSTLLSSPMKDVYPGISATSRKDYAEIICKGGFPLAQDRSRQSRVRWITSYLTMTLERDIKDYGKVRSSRNLEAVLSRVASQTAQIFSPTNLGSKMSIDKDTLANYIAALESVMLIRKLPAFGNTAGSRISKKPKMHVVDSGIAAQLMKINPEILEIKDVGAMTDFGHIAETFVFNEIWRQATWTPEVFDISHWRTRDGDEVDLVIEKEDGTVFGFEVKASSSVNPSDAKSLEKLRKAAGEKFAMGVVFYMGKYELQITEHCVALPIDYLWKST
jgi:predicted AAA+ superfamily ATPase